MRRKSLWKQTVAVTLSVTMLLGLPAEVTFAEEGIAESSTETVLETESEEDTKFADETEDEEETKVEGDYSYTANDDGAITIVKYLGSDTEVVIPSQIAGKTVRSIEENAFDGCTELTGVTIPETVQYVASQVFSDCVILSSIVVEESETSVYTSGGSNCIIKKDGYTLIAGCKTTVIPDYVTSIGFGAFSNCTGLTEITIPKGVTSIGGAAFDRCTGLTNVTIPETVTSIGSFAFRYCTGLTDITIPNGVTVISEDAFAGCTGLKNVTIPESVTTIQSGAFSNCTSLTSITIPGSVASIWSRTFAGCTGLTSCVISDGTTSLGYEAFMGCSELRNIKIPDSVTTIRATEYYDEYEDGGTLFHPTFYGCDNLTIYSSADSYARQFAIENNIPYKSLEEWVDSSCAHSNTEVRNAKSATCTETGYAGDTYCIDCGELISGGTAIAALGHTYTGTITTQPTVTSEGVKTYTCSRCGDTYTETIAKLTCTHTNTEVRNAKSATVTETGYTGDTYCVDCGILISSGTTIAKLTVSYTVKFNGNGATGGSMANQSITYGVTTALTANGFQRKGYTFKNWNTSKDGSGTAYANKADASKLTETNGAEITLYAQWTANKYTITFNGNGSTSGSMKKLSNCKYGKKYTLTKNGFKKKGYTFTGWNTKKDGSGKTYKNKAEVKNLSSKADGKVTLYAQWKKTKYTITYNLNKGKNNKNNPSSYNVTTKTIKLKNPTRKGYTFKGWYSDKKCTKKVTQIKKGSTGNVTLYAKWKKK